jgi:hypothetical protein
MEELFAVPVYEDGEDDDDFCDAFDGGHGLFNLITAQSTCNVWSTRSAPTLLDQQQLN